MNISPPTWTGQTGRHRDSWTT